MKLAKGKISKWMYVIFGAKIWICKSFISNSKIFMYLLWPCRVLVLERNLCFYCSSCISFNPTSQLNKNLFRGCVKLIGYFASVVNVISFNPCVGSSPRIMMSLFLLSTCTYELISALKIVTMHPSVNKIF